MILRFVSISLKLLIVNTLRRCLEWCCELLGGLFQRFYLVFENKGLIGIIRASSLKNKELLDFALTDQAVACTECPIIQDVMVARTEERSLFS